MSNISAEVQSKVSTMATAMQQQQELTIPVFTSKEEMRAFTRKQKLAGKTVGFVPTMVCHGCPANAQRGLAAVGVLCGSHQCKGRLQLCCCALPCRDTCTKATFHW